MEHGIPHKINSLNSLQILEDIIATHHEWQESPVAYRGERRLWDKLDNIEKRVQKILNHTRTFAEEFHNMWNDGTDYWESRYLQQS